MNKKKLLMFAIPMLAIGLVAALVGYYAMFSVSFSVLPSIVAEGDLVQELGEVYDGEPITGEPITLTNDAPTSRTLTITDDSIEDIEVSYLSSLSLTQKDTSTWATIGDPITITYTVVGDSFEVTGVPEGHSLIYYKDDDSNTDDEDRLLTIGEIGTTDSNLPHSEDWNWGELANYCDLVNGYDDYNQCKGAKLWIVPTLDIVDDDLTWSNMADYYYELDLIQYNAEGQIVLSPGASLTITPVYNISIGVSGEQTITTTVV